MKKLLFVALIVGFIAGCSGNAINEDYSEYRGKTSAQLFTSAEKHIASKKMTKATEELEALDAIYPFGPYAEQAQLDIIYAYYKSEDDASALAAAERYIRLYPHGKHVDYAYYMSGLIQYEDSMSWIQNLVGINPSESNSKGKQAAFLAFKSLVTLYPDSPYSADAILRMAYLRNLFARHEVKIADYYMKRKAFVSAANRASNVVVHYHTSPQVEPALAIMVKSYRALGLDQQADYSYAILKANFPTSKEIKALKQS